ncbi:MAG: TolC family protein [Cytophagales bacterium]|nr:MAG: TolC family protein [Cytophagales bacterium]
MKHTFFIFLLFVSSLQAWSQSPLTLEQCISKAMQENLSIKSARYDIDLTQDKISEVKAGLFPQVNLNANYQYNTQIATQLAPAAAFGGKVGEFRALQFGVPTTTLIGVSANQALFNAQLFIGLKAAKTASELSQLQLVKSQEEVVYNISATYYNAQSLAQQIEMLKKNMASLSKLIEISNLLYQNQLAKKIDVERLEVNKANLETQIENLQNTYSQLMNLLKFLTNTPQDTPLEIQTDIEKDLKFLTQETESIEQRIEYKLLNVQKTLNGFEQKQITSGYFPIVSLVGQYARQGFAKSGELSYTSFPVSFVGVQLQMNLFDGFNKMYKLRQKKIELQKIETQVATFKENANREIANARNTLKISLKSLAFQQTNMNLAQKIYEQTQLQFKEGMIGINDILNAENALKEAQTNYLTTLVKVRIAELELKKANGSLLSK